MKKIVIFLLIAGVLCFEINAQVIYVASDATGNNDGTSWQDAFTDLQDALTGTTGEVWVKVGTYFPTSGTDQNISFILNRDLYGGFNGTETARSQRDFRANETILSGNIGDPNDDQDNSFSIIDARNFSLIGLPGLIDGFTITKSQSGNTYDGQIGSHSIKNCIFEETVGNTAIFLNSISGAEIANCIFRNIDVSAGISTSAATITITSFTSNTVDIVNNLIFNAGNGIIILFANGTILNNSIVNNAGFSITDFQNSNLTVANNIITGNALTTSVLSGTLTNNIIEGTTDPNNFDLDPGFKDALNNDFSLTVCSDARNLGDNAFVPVSITEDVLGNTRIFDGMVDVGAFEVQAFPIQINAVETLDIECFEASTGQIALGVTGGTGALDYSIDGVNFQSSSVFTGLASGTYTIEVRDEDGCMDMASATLNELSTSVLSFSTSTVANVCQGESLGQIIINASGGTGPYSYSIDGTSFQSGSTFAGLTGGTYEITVLDAVGCAVTNEVIVSDPLPLDLDATITSITCPGESDGAISAGASGGTPGYVYSIDGSTFDPSSNFSGLAAGSYTITVRDVNSCEYTELFVVTQPDEISVSVTQADISCNGLLDGSLTVSASGGISPYEYSIDGITFQSATVFDGLSAGSYTITAKDAQGCTNSVTAIIEEPSPVVIQDSFTITNASCFGASDGMIELSSSGGSGTYEYSIDGATFSLSPLTGLTANTYTISARDGNGCLSNNTQTITVGQPTALEVSASFDGSQVNLAAAGGTTPYEYSLDRGTFQSEAIFTLGNGNYTFTVRDANGCEANTQEVTTVTSTDLNVELITNLYPNPVQNQLTIQHSSVIRQVRIADFNGKFISSYLGKENAASIDVSTLKKGVYLIEVKSTDGSVSYLRFVKE